MSLQLVSRLSAIGDSLLLQCHVAPGAARNPEG
jgi:hypothetical protein